METILGAGGPVSNALAQIFIKENTPVKLISRREVKLGGSSTWQKADLLSKTELSKAVKGATVIYMCAGLQYKIKVWQAQWPVIMRNIIEVTKENNARLIFFDNVYMYGLVNGHMTEDSPYNPISEKGKVRAQIANMLMGEVKKGHLKATIARAADFYGAESLNSFYDAMVLNKYSKNQRAQWLGNANTKHSFTSVPDAANGIYLLGKHPESDNQIWHLPTAPALTGKEFIKIAADAFNVAPKFSSINKLMLRLAGLFSPVIGGTVEMFYQYDHDYIFDSSKFEKAFSVKPTSYQEGVKHLSETLFKHP